MAPSSETIIHRARRLRSSKGFATFVVSTAIFTDTFLYDLIIPALPSILKSRASIPDDQVQKWTSILLAAFGALLFITPPIAGILTDSIKTKQWPFLVGLIILALSTGMFFLGRHIIVLVVARALQGMSAAIVWISGLAVFTLYAGEGDIGTGTGFFSVGLSAGELAGPVVGGFVYSQAGHYALLAVAASIVALDIFLRLVLKYPEAHESEGVGETSSTPAESDALLENDHPDEGLDHVVNSNSKRLGRFIHFSYQKEYLASLVLIVAASTIRTAFESTLSIFTEKAFGWSSTGAGLTLFCLVGPSLAGPYFGHFTEAYGPRWLSFASCLALSVSFPGLAFAQHNNTATKVLFCVCISICGLALSAIITSQQTAVPLLAMKYEKACKRRNIESSITSQAYAYLYSAYSGGMFLGPLWTTAVIDNFGWQWFCASFSALSVLACILAGICLKSEKKRSPR